MEEGKKTGRTALKTALYTLLCLILALVFAGGVFCLAAPKAAGDFFHRLGAGKFSVYLTKAGYDRSGDINDLADTVERSMSAGCRKVTAEYAEKLIGHPDYSDFVLYRNLQAESSLDLTLDYDGYIKGGFVDALYRTGEAERAFERAKTYLPAEGYPALNPMNRFVEAFCGDDGSGFPVKTVTDFLTERYYAAVEDADLRADAINLTLDMYLLSKKAGDRAGMTYWENQYKDLTAK